MSTSDKRLCPHCRKEINESLPLCPLCGGQIPDEKKLETPRCPRCNTLLVKLFHKNDEYDFCPDCEGLWLDREEFRRATRELNVFRDDEIEGNFLKTPPQDTLKYIPCVRCGKLMLKKNFAKISGVIIDECSRHGVWLDPGELQKIRQFIADGGLQRAQDKEI